jgi:hypothetical protein
MLTINTSATILTSANLNPKNSLMSKVIFEQDVIITVSNY